MFYRLLHFEVIVHSLCCCLTGGEVKNKEPVSPLLLHWVTPYANNTSGFYGDSGQEAFELSGRAGLSILRKLGRIWCLAVRIQFSFRLFSWPSRLRVQRLYCATAAFTAPKSKLECKITFTFTHSAGAFIQSDARRRFKYDASEDLEFDRGKVSLRNAAHILSQQQEM